MLGTETISGGLSPADGRAQSCPHLRAIIRGHQWDMKFQACSTACTIVHRLVSQQGVHMPDWPRGKTGWQGTLRKGVLDMGWSETSKWTWTHAGLSENVSLRSDSADWIADLPKLRHVLRESWRHTCFVKWLGQTRRDSQECAGIPCDPRRIRDLRFVDMDSHAIAVTAGAQVSPVA